MSVPVLDSIEKIAQAGEGILDKFIDTPEEKAKAKALLREKQVEMMAQAQKGQAQRAETIRAEIKGQSWLQRNWRPIVALSFAFIPINNFILLPYVRAFGGNVPMLDLPGWIGALITTMVGGYTGLRSWEKKHGKADNPVPSITDKVLQRIGDATSGGSG